ncbi:caspase domain-containing protein [Streptomyces sp. NPDC098789]|uniref:caspase family protein n=1 Tax=Streptomyces sp. NPDC098789 TaxID=3366098 RepID=UPI00382125C9
MRPSESRAVLIGVADYPDGGVFTGVEAALHNVLRLKGILTDPAYAGFGRLPEYTRPVLNPQTGEGIRAAVKRAAEQATDVLFVYYVGHGSRVGAERELYLTSCTTSSAESVETTGLRYTVLRSVLRAARARVVVLVLDCCFSGIATKVLGDGTLTEENLAEDELLDRAAAAYDVDEGLIDGVCVLASSGPAQTSGASDTVGETDFTAFTGHLVAVLEQRRGDAGPLLLGELFQRTEKRMGRYDVGHQPLMASVGAAGNLVMRQALARPPETTLETPPQTAPAIATAATAAGADADADAPDLSPRRLLTWRTPAGPLDVFDQDLANRIIGMLERSASETPQHGERTTTRTPPEGGHHGA